MHELHRNSQQHFFILTAEYVKFKDFLRFNFYNNYYGNFSHFYERKFLYLFSLLLVY